MERNVSELRNPHRRRILKMIASGATFSSVGLSQASESNDGFVDVLSGLIKQTNNAISTSTNQLGALLNSLSENGAAKDGKSGRGKASNPSVPDSLGIAITNRTELAIDHLSDARKTPLKG